MKRPKLFILTSLSNTNQLTRFFYTQHFYKQLQAEFLKKLSKKPKTPQVELFR